MPNEMDRDLEAILQEIEQLKGVEADADYDQIRSYADQLNGELLIDEE
ncbi:hypothetical protein [Paenibacillus roseipurpureus]|uniref:Uncharacterized protein n=1 Tax=Paenibacillus roseopurpureus TaxID=2918901 RepID=A0AA96LHX0_9BACL|nr:hypothetical protein [Paenibacillus sp. MBLB1832]WNR42077.1 hypothetical protein MJB10_13115 [Paenibacillus sp. MBLB1832]